MPSPTSLSAVRAEALARRDRGDLSGARVMLEHALEAATLTSGEDHPEVLRTSHLLATFHRQSGDLSSARRVLENAIYAGTNKHGEEFGPLLAMSFDLAEIADELGNRHEARRQYTKIARYGPQVGFDEQLVRAARAWLGPAAPPSSVPTLGQPVTLPGPTPLAALPSGTPTDAHPPLSPPDADLARRTGAPSSPPAPHQPPPTPQQRMSIPAAGQQSTARQSEIRQVAQQRTAPPSSAPPVSPAPPNMVLPAQQQAPAPAAPRGRFAVIAASGAAIVAVLAAAITLLLVLLPKGDDPGPGEELPPITDRQAATDLELIENRGTVVLTWTDPSNGLAAQIVVGNRKGQANKVFGQPENGDEQIALEGLNPTWDYCFQVILVYSSDEFIESSQVCTNRTLAPSPGS